MRKTKLLQLVTLSLILVFSLLTVIACTNNDNIEKYTITWKNGEEVLFTQEVEKGKMPEFSGDIPTKDADENQRYVFKGWDPDIVPATADAVYNAEFDIIKLWTATFKNEDGTVLYTVKLDEGTIPIYVGETPEKAATESKIFVFNNWDPIPVEITEDTVYTATFTEMDRKYKVTFISEGSQYGEIQEILYNGFATLPQAPSSTDPIRVFQYWSVGGEEIDVETYAITEDTEFVAVFSVDYSILFEDDFNLVDINSNYNILSKKGDGVLSYPYDSYGVPHICIVRSSWSVFEVVFDSDFIAAAKISGKDKIKVEYGFANDASEFYPAFHDASEEKTTKIDQGYFPFLSGKPGEEMTYLTGWIDISALTFEDGDYLCFSGLNTTSEIWIKDISFFDEIVKDYTPYFGANIVDTNSVEPIITTTGGVRHYIYNDELVLERCNEARSSYASNWSPYTIDVNTAFVKEAQAAGYTEVTITYRVQIVEGAGSEAIFRASIYNDDDVVISNIDGAFTKTSFKAEWTDYVTVTFSIAGIDFENGNELRFDGINNVSRIWVREVSFNTAL